MEFDIKQFFSQKNNIISTLLVTLVVIFIGFLFPQGARFNLEYKQGEIWSHDDLLAPFEFPLLKNQTELEKAREKTSQDFVPTFRKTAVAGAVHDNVYDYVNNLRQDMDSDDFSRLIEYLASTDNKILISKDQLEVEGSAKSSFYIVEKSGRDLYAYEDYVLIEDFIRRINTFIPVQYQSEIGNLVSIEAEIDQKRTEQALKEAVQRAISSNLIIKKGELIVSKGNLVTQQVYQKLVSLEAAFSRQQVSFLDGIGAFFGYIVLTFLILAALVIYLHFHFPSILNSPKELAFILLWIVIFPFLVFQIERTPGLNSYMIPFCIAPIIIKTYYEERLALFVHIVIVLIASFLSRLGYEFTFLQILAGIVTVLLIEETRYWNRFFISILIIIVTYFLGFLGLSMANTNQFTGGLDSSVFKWLGINGVLILLAYPFIPLLSKIFGFTSSIDLVELADLNKPLLKKLSLNAPGTFQHSLQVSNLSEAAADKIGANSLLIKVAALYHDIGKLKNPMLFIENQKEGSYNPHEELNYFDSARGIIDHVIEGEKMGRQSGLPKEIITLICSHHGTTRVEFFYRKQLADFPDKEFDETIFQYPGPKPITKEEAILMLADSIEAASKSLKQPIGKDIDELVEKIAAHKIQSHQLSESKLTFEEIDICLQVFKEMLRSIYHVRIEYPKAVN